MGLAIQYDLFEDQSEVSQLRKELLAVKESNDSVRRGLFARHNEMMKLLLEQRAEIDKMKALSQ